MLELGVDLGAAKVLGPLIPPAVVVAAWVAEIV